MGQLKSGIKRHKQSLKKRIRNRHIRSTVKTAIKDVRAAIEEHAADKAGPALAQAVSAIQRAGSKGVLHWKTAARKVARLAKAVNKAAAAK